MDKRAAQVLRAGFDKMRLLVKFPVCARPFLLLAGAFALHLCGCWILPLIDRDEPRFAEAAREMRERQDWVVPRFNNSLRLDKPPLIYWVQNAVVACLGESDMAVRLPSALAAALTSLVVYWFGRRIASERLGLRAGLMYATSLQVMLHAKLAVADHLMVLFVTLAFWAGYEWLRPEESPGTPGNGGARRGWLTLFFASLALAFLAKGPVGWLPLLAVPVFLAWNGGTRPRQDAAGFAFGLLGTLGIIALWGLPALWRTNGEFLAVGIGKHVLQRSFAVLEGHGVAGWLGYAATLPFYFLGVFASFFPWAIALPAMAREIRRHSGIATLDRWLLTGTGLTFVIFSLVRTKLPHYTLPAFPLLTLWIAWRWEQKQSWPSWFGAAAAAMVLANLAFSFVASPLLRARLPSLILAQKTSPWIHKQTQIAAVGYTEPSLVWYFRAHTACFMEYPGEAGLQSFLDRPGSRICILPSEMATRILGAQPAGCRRVDVEGINPVNGKRARLCAVVKADGEPASGSTLPPVVPR